MPELTLKGQSSFNGDVADVNVYPSRVQKSPGFAFVSLPFLLDYLAFIHFYVFLFVYFYE